MRILTIHRIVANHISDLLDDASPANFLYVFCVRNHETDLAVVYLVVPRVQSVSDSDMLEAVSLTRDMGYTTDKHTMLEVFAASSPSL